jgi:hypothetical protein
MAGKGKIEQWGAGSRRAPQQRAERAARRSQKRADERRWRREEEGRRTEGLTLPPPASSVELALVPPLLRLWEFARDIEEMTAKTEELFT